MIILWWVIKTEIYQAKINVDKAAAMYAIRKNTVVTWIKEAVPKYQFILRCIQRNISGQ